MAEYYEPMLYLSTPEHPNTMGAVVTLKEAVDGDILQEVVEELRERFPYFYVRTKPTENDLIPIPNPLPMTVRNTWEPIKLRSEEANYHLAAFKYMGNRLALEMSHSISDGAGFLPYIKSVLFLYLSRKTGQNFDPSGFRLPGSVIPKSEIGDPFSTLDIDNAEPPLYQKETLQDFYRMNQDQEKTDRLFCLMLPEKEVMQYCKENDGSPNVIISVLLARAIRRVDPESEKTVSICVAIDHKALLGNHENYRMFAGTVDLDFPQNRDLSDIMKSCTIARGQVMLQAQSENSLWAMKQRKLRYAKFEQIPLQMKTDIIAKASGNPRWTAAVSYANSRSFGVLDPYIEELYILSEPGVMDMGIEVTCINHKFFLAMSQNFSSDKYFEAFLEELSAAGIPYEIRHKEEAKLSGITAW